MRTEDGDGDGDGGGVTSNSEGAGSQGSSRQSTKATSDLPPAGTNKYFLGAGSRVSILVLSAQTLTRHVVNNHDRRIEPPHSRNQTACESVVRIPPRRHNVQVHLHP